MPHPARRIPRYKLEHLEDRWVPTTVTNLDDAGPGELGTFQDISGFGGVLPGGVFVG